MRTIKDPKQAFWGVPTFFRGCCYSASEGGQNSYSEAAWHLSLNLYRQVPDAFDHKEWFQEIDGLRELLKVQDGAAVLQWFDDHFPRCMELVPARRRQQFLKGVERAYEQRRL